MTTPMTEDELAEVAKSLVTLALEERLGRKVDHARDILPVLADVPMADLPPLLGHVASIAAMLIVSFAAHTRADPTLIWRQGAATLYRLDDGEV
jgi:hypothetical protein